MLCRSFVTQQAAWPHVNPQIGLPDTVGLLWHSRRGFCQRVVHPDSGFFYRYHTQRGDKEVAVSPWQAHPVIGEVRELRFISPVSVGIPFP